MQCNKLKRIKKQLPNILQYLHFWDGCSKAIKEHKHIYTHAHTYNHTQNGVGNRYSLSLMQNINIHVKAERRNCEGDLYSRFVGLLAR